MGTGCSTGTALAQKRKLQITRPLPRSVGYGDAPWSALPYTWPATWPAHGRPAMTSHDAGDHHTAADRVRAAVASVVVGNGEALEQLLVALLCRSHALVEDVPGVGKTLLARSLAAALGCTFPAGPVHPRRPSLRHHRLERVQPAHARTSSSARARSSPRCCWPTRSTGPRPRTQSALLEAMEERQVTVDGQTTAAARALLRPGHPEPDRARGHLSASRGPARPFPGPRHARAIRAWRTSTPSSCGSRATTRSAGSPGRRPPRRSSWPSAPRRVTVSDPVRCYLVDLVRASRRQTSGWRSASAPAARSPCTGPSRRGPSWRAASFAIPDDVKALAVPVLAHRLIVTAQARLRGTHPAQSSPGSSTNSPSRWRTTPGEPPGVRLLVGGIPPRRPRRRRVGDPLGAPGAGRRPRRAPVLPDGYGNESASRTSPIPARSARSGRRSARRSPSASRSSTTSSCRSPGCTSRTSFPRH